MELAYAAADLVVCRAGAMTCAELAAVGLPAAYVPLPHGNGEQRLNAAPTVEAGGGLLVDGRAITPTGSARTCCPAVDPERLPHVAASGGAPATPTSRWPGGYSRPLTSTGDRSRGRIDAMNTDPDE